MRKGILRGGGFSVLLVVGAALAGCFSPDLGLAECARCSGSCVGDLVCREGFCVYPASTITCSQSSGGGAGEPAEAGAAGLPHVGGSMGAGVSGGTGGATWAGASGEAGAGAAEGGAAGHGSLEIEVAGPEHGCTRRDFASSWSVVGGVEPYAWTLVQAPPGFVLTSGGDQAAVEGTPTLTGDQRFRVRVTDADGNTAERELVVPVLATPILPPRELPDVCNNEIYSQPFTAEGASAGGLTWSVNSEFVEQTGLDFEGDRLTGTFLGVEQDTFVLEVTAANGTCAADPVEFTLAALGSGHPSCPNLVAAAKSDILPQPCIGQAYEAELHVEGGSGDYSLEAVAIPEALSFDRTTQTLSGLMNAPGTTTLRVADDNGHTIEQSFELEPRSSCWLAYLSDETGVSRVHLFDPELERHHVVSSIDAGAAVLDFEFSPDGRALAFRSSAGTDATRVELVGMTALDTSPLAFESATAYAWSEDSATLAVAYDTPNGRYLGGAALAKASPETDPLVTALTPVEAAVDSELVWFAGSLLGFFTNFRADVAWMGTTSRIAGGFSTPRLPDIFHERGSRLRAGASGVFLFPPSDLDFTYFDADGSPFVLHAQIPRALRALSPSGRYLARVTEPNLELFPAGKSSSYGAPADDVEPGCDAILDWAEERERIACATSEDGGRVSIFDVNTSTDALGARQLVSGSYTFLKGSHTQRWRAFSQTGTYFAFTSDDTLSVASLNDGTPRVLATYDLAIVTAEDDSFYSELAFSPDERFLAVHRSRYLRIFDSVPERVTYVDVSAGMRASERCEEDFTSRTGPYCGTELPAAPYAWSGDSRWLAYQEQAGTLWVMDLRQLPESRTERVLVGEPCAETCPGGSAFAYQPH